MKEEFFVEVTKEDAVRKIRIDAFLSEKFEDFSRTYIKKLITDGDITIDGKEVKSNYIIKENDEIILEIEPPSELEVEPENIPIDILYEDDDIVIVNKKKGMVVHPAPGNYSGTLVNALLYHCKGKLSGINGVLRPGIVHRIDKNTEGILVVAKSSIAHERLTDLFKVHDITRKYHAIVCGNFNEDEGTVDAPIGRSDRDRKKMAVNMKNSKRAVTHYKVLERYGKYTYIECMLETGRTHQIRVHMASIHHPLLGDDIYGSVQNEFNIEGQMLIAKVLGFVHPITNKYVEFEIELSNEFKNILEKIKNKYGVEG